MESCGVKIADLCVQILNFLVVKINSRPLRLEVTVRFMLELFNSGRHPLWKLLTPFINCSPSAIATITVIQGAACQAAGLPVNEWVSVCHLGSNQGVESGTGIQLPLSDFESFLRVIHSLTHIQRNRPCERRNLLYGCLERSIQVMHRYSSPAGCAICPWGRQDTCLTRIKESIGVLGPDPTERMKTFSPPIISRPY